MPIPREAMRLVGTPEAPRLLTRTTKIDHTQRMLRWSEEKALALQRDDLCGFIFKSRSPSSGMERVKVYDENGIPHGTSPGIFARIMQARFPLLPMEDEGRLHDARLRENFIESIFVYKRWREFLQQPGAGALVSFHTVHKLLLLAHSERHYRQMGKLVANIKKQELATVVAGYQEQLMAAMRLRPTVKKHVNVLLHILGYFKKCIDADEKREMLEIIDAFHKELVPLIVPITLVNHYVRKYQQAYLLSQYYLNPHPIELKLRNHA